jgi:hypothetical protein
LKGGCSPGVVMLLNHDISFNEYIYLDKRVTDWTTEDFEDYKRVYLECARQYPMPVTGVLDDPGNVIWTRNTNNHIDQISRFVWQRAQRERQQAIDVAEAKQEMERSAAEARRQKLLDAARRERESAEQAAKQAEAEAPLIAEAERQFAEASRQREEAERRLQDVRSRVAAQQQQRAAEDNKRNAALNEQRRVESAERDQAFVADLTGKPCKVTLGQFEQVRYGMNLRQVQEIFGCLGRMAQGSRIAGVGTYSTYVFQGTSDLSAVSATFRGSSLEQKSQIGLD